VSDSAKLDQADDQAIEGVAQELVRRALGGDVDDEIEPLTAAELAAVETLAIGGTV
jgi:hypothetical protein